MHTTDMNTHAQSTTMWFIRGALLGAVITALFTPKRGTEMRQHLGETMDNLKRSAQDKANTAADNAQDAVNSVKSQVGRKRNGDNDNMPQNPIL